MRQLIFIGLLAILSHATPPTLMFIGDSLTAGYQLSLEDAFPAIIESRIGTKNIQIINAGISGDTTYSVLNRLAYTLTTTPNMVFLCIGANDGLRGIPPEITKKNIEAMINLLKNRNIPVVLAGISLPKNYTKQYIDAFETTFADIAKTQNLPFMPFLLKNVAGIPTLNLNDRIHPNKKGHQIIANNVYAFLVSENIVTSQNKLIINRPLH